MSLIDFFNDRLGFREVARGTDGRVNVSSRSDSRGYYNSRDQSESFYLTFFDTRGTANDYVAYLKNDKTDKSHMVIREISAGSQSGAAVFKLIRATGTVTGGDSATPFNLNSGGLIEPAAVTARTASDSNASPLANVTEDALIDLIGQDAAYGHEEFHLDDQLRIGPGQAIAVEFDIGSTDDDVFGRISFYFEAPK